MVFQASRTQMILGLCVPLAVLIGFFLAEPMQFGSLAVLALIGATLIFPLVMRWHYPLLVFSWNAAVVLAFLPGAPPLWMPMAGVSLLVLVLSRAVSDRHPIRHVPSVTKPLTVLLVVVFTTALFTGGIGIRTLGSGAYGGKGYFYIAAAAAGYVGLCSKRIPPARAGLYAGLFFLPGLTSLLSNLAYAGGERFWWLFYVLPGKFAYEQIRGEAAINVEMVRLGGIGPAALALLFTILAIWGLRGLMNLRAPWRMLLFLVSLAGCVLSGFRSFLVLFVLVVFIQFFLEGLHRSPKFPILVLVTVLIGVVALANAERLPTVMQRTLSVFPVKVSYEARRSAEDSNRWRLEMWGYLLRQVPHYLLKGKGYAFDPNQLDMAVESASRGYGGRYQHAAEAGDYHNGPLSVIIPFGIWGVGAFVWFLAASVRYLYGNYRRSAATLRKVNTFVLTLFLAKAVFFLLIYGSFYVDFPLFLGLVAFSAALNGWGREGGLRREDPMKIRRAIADGQGPAGQQDGSPVRSGDADG